MPSNVIYTRIDQVLTSCTSLEAQLALIETILMNMLAAINQATITGTWEEYKLDTGQTRSEIRYRSLKELQEAFQAMSKTRRMLLNELNFNRTGRQFRLVDGKNFPGRSYYWNGW